MRDRTEWSPNRTRNKKSSFPGRRNCRAARLLNSASGDTAPAPNSPGLWIVHTAKRVVFTAGKLDRGLGLDAQGG